MNDEKQFGFLITADGIIKEMESGAEKEGTWELNDEEPLVLKVFADGKLQIALNITFINDDEFGIHIACKN